MNILKIKKIIRTSLLATTVLIAFYGCHTATNDSENISGEDTSATKHDLKVNKTKNIFYSIPSPIETALLLKKAGATFNKGYLNPIDNLSKYTSLESRALNLGVYGTDLSFANIFNQNQESILYLKSANNLAGGLGISGAFGQQTLARMEANMNNQDSLLSIIADAFWATDASLKENGRPNISSLIIVGGWVEGLFIATQIAKTTNNQGIINRIAEQKLSLDNMISLIESYEADEHITPVLTQLKDLKTIFDGMEITKSKTEVATNKKTGVATIGNKTKIAMSQEQLTSIYSKIETIRNKIIN